MLALKCNSDLLGEKTIAVDANSAEAYEAELRRAGFEARLQEFTFGISDWDGENIRWMKLIEVFESLMQTVQF